MKLHRLTAREHLLAIGIGALVSILLSAIMVPAFMSGISPMPKPLGLAFAELLLLDKAQQGPGKQSPGQGASGEGQSQPGQPSPGGGGQAASGGAQPSGGGQASSGGGQAPGGGQAAGPAAGKGGGGKGLPLPVGLAFHFVYVAFWSWVFVILFRDRPTLPRALLFAVVLWVLVLVVFFPIVGWGFLGLGVGPELIGASAVLHLLFAIFLWALCRIGFPARPLERAHS